MQLTKLEVKGFKSFGDKITIHFDKGITGIVGPNGCGKSNVVDSIRWVLGEQKTRALRSDKMENVIFNGTKTRKPLQLVEASLTFSNTKNLLPTEYSEVTITRRYYRTGESEYLLNNVPCRLKDITNLFLDTGIGPDSYAIIELKMVDEILNDKENSRRNLFEEAAGVAKFRVRKKETLRKLEDADNDLKRVEDILFEISKNLKTLEKQAKQTERYFSLKEEYKQVSILLAKKGISERKDSFIQLGRQIQEESDKKLNFNTLLTEKEAFVEQEKLNLLDKEKLLSTRQRTLNEHINKIRQYESEKKIKSERLRFLQDKEDKLREQTTQDKLKKEELILQADILEKNKLAAEQAFSTIKQELDGLKTTYEEQKQKTSALQAQASELNKHYKEKQEKNFQINKDLEVKQTQLTSLKYELEKTTTDSETQTANLTNYEDQVQEASEALQESKQALEDLQVAEAAIQAEIEDIQHQIEDLKESLVQQNRQLDAKQNEYNLTKSLVDNLEGFPEAIKFLKKNTDWSKNAPLLSDILACDEKFRVAIENYLEPVMNYYVVETQQQAYQAVNLLSDASKGKANFFILEKFKDFTPTPKKELPNAIQALAIVDFDEKYSQLVSYVLDNAYIIDTQNTDTIAAVKEDVILIAQNGKITQRKFSIAGGSVGLFEGKRIGRAKNLEILEKEIQAITEKINSLKNQINLKQTDLQDLRQNTKKEALLNVQKEITQLQENFIMLRTKQEQLHQLITHNRTRKEDMEERILFLQEDIARLQPQAKAQKEDFSELEKTINALNVSLLSENEALAVQSSQFNASNIRYHQQESSVASIIQEINFKQSTLQTIEARVEENSEELQKIQEDIQTIVQNTEVEDDVLIDFYKEKETIEQGLNEVEKAYYAARGNIELIEKQAKEIQRQKELVDALLVELQNKLNENKLNLTSIKERLSVEFNIDLDTILDEQEVEIIESELEIRVKVSEVKEKLDKIGPINPMAMEAFKEIKERHDFIVAQRDDLFKAKDSLLMTIAEIDQVAQQNFLLAFEKIRENFIQVFRSLFSEEDTCDLILTDPSHPLDSSIDIMAKPKGKRPLTINQLSGGEKTLTAISLLFAIYLLKPAPFCIFDEVDAPLDDANIDKFNTIIRKFANESQFIIVTHNKRTMASTDIIYGITMLEQGVSKVVPVDLRGLEEVVL